MCAEQGIALKGHREQDSSNGTGKNSDTERTIQREKHLEKGAKNAKMVSWQIQNDIIECLSEFVRSKINVEIPDYYAIIANEVPDRLSNNKFHYFSILLLLQRNGIYLSKCRAQAYEGTSAMSTEA